jgi:hypothetical protein
VTPVCTTVPARVGHQAGALIHTFETLSLLSPHKIVNLVHTIM